MIILRKLLVRLRAEYNDNPRRLYTILGAAFLALALFTLLVDGLLPPQGYANLVRSVLLVPTAVATFSLVYSISIFFHLRRMEGEEGWLPYRARFSPAWRRRIALIGGAILLVLTQAVGPGLGYTLASSFVGAGVIALLAFVRTAKQESSREALGIPDSRDVLYDAQKRQIERDFALRQAQKKKSRSDKLRGAVEKKSSRASKK